MAQPSSQSSNKVTLELYASGLKNVAGFGKGKSDPFAVVTLLSSNPNEKPIVLGKTEVIKNSLSPRWTTSFELDYQLGRLSRVNIGIYDENRKGNNKSMGSALFEIGEVLGARGNTKAKVLRPGGTLFCRIQPSYASSAGLLRLGIAGRQLKNVDGLFGKSDPFFELNSATNAAGGATWHPVYRSKHIDNNLNPDWEGFSVDVNRLCGGDLDKPILIQIFDWERSGKHTNMGSFETSVKGLLEAVGRDGFVAKRKGKPYGKIIVTRASIDGGAVNGSTARKHAPTPTPYASTSASSVVPLSPPVAPQQSRGSYVAAPYKKPPFLAASTMTVGAASTLAASTTQSHYGAPQPSAPFVPSACTRYRTVSGSSAGASCNVVPAPAGGMKAAPIPPAIAPPVRKTQFVEYLAGGCELELSVAIDFTGSNGDPRKPGTLHYIHRDGQLNDYEKAITAVGAIIARYDSDQKFPVLGFGAKIGGVIRHCFQVGNGPELDRVQGILEGYRAVFRTGLTMSGPTDVTEVINYAAASARSKQDASLRLGQQSYRILLILTDGAVSDIEATKRALDAASDAPLSVVIVGIGSADFSGMRFLDDFQTQGGNGRDICQFVEFSRFQHDKAALTRETLDEIPDQLVNYFFSRGIKPLPPISGSQISLYPDEAGEEDIDLSIAVNDEGEISLENYDGAYYDDTKYDSYSVYMAPIPPAIPPPAMEPFVPSAPPGPYHQLPSQQYPRAPPAVVAAQPIERIFHVLVPPGVAPGTQLQVQNPVTGAMVLVSVPPGVPSGGKFGVRY